MENNFNKNIIKAKIDKSKRRLSGDKSASGQVQGSGPPNAHGMPKLPPGQHEVPNWPVLDLGVKPKIPKKNWRLDVKGEVKNPYSLTWDEFMALPQVEDVSDFHCVTTWSRMDNHWKDENSSGV